MAIRKKPPRDLREIFEDRRIREIAIRDANAAVDKFKHLLSPPPKPKRKGK